VQTSWAAKARIREENEMETRNKTITLHMQSYEPIGPTSDPYCSITTFPLIWCTGKLHVCWGEVEIHTDTIWTRPKCNNKRCSKEKRGAGNKWTKGNVWTASVSTALPLPNTCFSNYLFLVGDMWAYIMVTNHQYGRWSTHDVASMGASTGGVGHGRQWYSIA